MSIRRNACAPVLLILAAPALAAGPSEPKSVANDPRVVQALELARTWLATMDPVEDMDRFRKVGEDRFRRIRKDDSLGEEIVFEIGPDGRASRFSQHSNYYPRVR
jgi:hypothetical protein